MLLMKACDGDDHDDDNDDNDGDDDGGGDGGGGGHGGGVISYRPLYPGRWEAREGRYLVCVSRFWFWMASQEPNACASGDQHGLSAPGACEAAFAVSFTSVWL
jgi:hypothetical protein